MQAASSPMSVDGGGVGGDEQLHERLRQQHRRVRELNKSALQLGQQWALVSMRWLSAWGDYAGGGDSLSQKLGSDTYHPGPIDNSSILGEDGQLRKHLLPEIDFTCCHMDAWQLLVDCYGAKQAPILRSVIQKGKYSKTLEVEVYLLELKLAEYSDPKKQVERRFSRMAKFKEVEAEMRRLFAVAAGAETRLWASLSGTSYELLQDKEQPLEHQVYNNQYLLLEVRSADGHWPRSDGASSFSRPSPYLSSSGGRFSTAAFASAGLAGAAQPAAVARGALPGLCGLSNLGNTCFMNSALQALSNVPPLTEYFLADRWQSELNVDNPLGMRGEIARSYGELVKAVWSGLYSHTAPRAFKIAVGQFAPQFSGFQQQDSQELMAFLLDGLHEDLNRIRQKPYVEVKDADGRPDHEAARDAWNNYKLRNHSVIVDLFHGLLKSTLVCPDCRKVSVTFDPFCYLSLPVPKDSSRQVMFHLVPSDPQLRPRKCKLALPGHATVAQLQEEIGRRFGVAAGRLLLAEVYANRLHRIFDSASTVADVNSERCCIYAYELPEREEKGKEDGEGEAEEAEEEAVVKVYFCTSSGHCFSPPAVLSLPMSQLTAGGIRRQLLQRCRRFLTVGDDPDDRAEAFELLRCNAMNSQQSPLPEETGQLAADLYVVAKFSSQWKLRCFNEREANECERDPSCAQAPARRQHHLEDCLKLFTEEERLGKKDAWYCPACKDFRQASKKFDLWSLPKVLVMHLKRFQYDRYFRNKIDDLVDFPTRGLDMSNWLLNPSVQEGPATYDLVSVANHYGGLGGGHYTAYGRNCRDAKWHYFDDSSVTASAESQVVTQAAYVLIYLRSDLAAGQPQAPPPAAAAALASDDENDEDEPAA